VDDVGFIVLEFRRERVTLNFSSPSARIHLPSSGKERERSI
jgi:hypothetical protein